MEVKTYTCKNCKHTFPVPDLKGLNIIYQWFKREKCPVCNTKKKKKTTTSTGPH